MPRGRVQAKSVFFFFFPSRSRLISAPAAPRARARGQAGDPTLDPELVIGSLAAEMGLLSGGHMLVGTSSSWVSRLAFLTMVARRGTTPPFIFLDGPFGCLGIKPCAVS